MPGKILKIAFRNLMRYKRRTLLTTSIVAIGVIFVLLFVSVAASLEPAFKASRMDPIKALRHV